MSYLNTELMKTLLQNGSVDEFFRQQLESTINELFQAELTAFLGYEKHSSDGWGSGNSRNGFYARVFETKYGKLNLRVPRDRKGEFEQHLIPDYARRSDSLETMVIQLYRNGITTREIADLIEKMYGHHYSAATVSNIAKTVEGQVEKFHTRQVAERYAVIYCDATYLCLRRDTVAKEALHVILGITPDGKKEVLDYAIYPTESASNYEDMLVNLKQRGLKEVLLFVSDGLIGIRDALLRQFPQAQHQSCWVHICRNVAKLIRLKDRRDVLADLKPVYTQETASDAEKELDRFIDKYRDKYPKLAVMFQSRVSLFAFYQFPKEIRASIYTSNIVENNNKGLKHKTKLKEQFPNEEALERFLCEHYSEYNRKSFGLSHRGFKQAEAELLMMFDERYTTHKSTIEQAA